MILTSKCEKCKYGIIDDSDKAKIMVYCEKKEKNYYYGQCIPCEEFEKEKAGSMLTSLSHVGE